MRLALLHHKISSVDRSFKGLVSKEGHVLKVPESTAVNGGATVLHYGSDLTLTLNAALEFPVPVS